MILNRQQILNDQSYKGYISKHSLIMIFASLHNLRTVDNNNTGNICTYNKYSDEQSME